MSTVITDNLTGKTSAGSVTITSEGGSATMQLQQGVAKAWMQLNGTGTIAIQGSFNTTSATDNGTGDYTQTFSSALANNDFSVVSDGSVINDTFNQGTAASSPTTTTCRVNVWNTSSDSQEDFNQVYTSVLGDLA